MDTTLKKTKTKPSWNNGERLLQRNSCGLPAVMVPYSLPNIHKLKLQTLNHPISKTDFHA